MKTEELNVLTDEELVQVTGGSLADSLKKLQDGMKIDSGTDDSGGINWDCFANCLIEHGYVHEKLDQAGNKLPIVAVCMGKCS